MASKSKPDLNQNFEMLKKQMQKKRELAENTINLKEIKENDDLKVEGLPSSSNETTNSDVDMNLNKIIIKKVVKPEAPKRITYYLKPDTIKKIDKFSKMAGMGKSEFVQKILDEVLNNLEIEK